jgi:hypothetical protein
MIKSDIGGRHGPRICVVFYDFLAAAQQNMTRTDSFF